MYLKRIEMRGFKSFADKTEIVFQNGVTCVVGPNGSGKSNITDAVRWVLGEQRVKTLRGTKMEDVIFNGTKHRKSLGLAEVKLTFDNTTQFFPLEYDEITIVRKVHRSGDSEYYINQMPCRLKDVRELFMDTGIGREGYSIIGQGRIDEVLSNNKDERRLLFEEAAGIVKYKGRKIETERKLKATEENLLRIKDILSEIEDRVEPLRKESERAKTYLDLTEMLKNIEVYEFQNRYNRCEQNILKTLELKSGCDDELIAINERRQKRQETYNQVDQTLYKMNVHLRQLEEERHQLTNQESRFDGEKQLILEKITNNSGNIDRVKREIVEAESEKTAIELQFSESESQFIALETSLNDMKSAYEHSKNLREQKFQTLNQLKAENASDHEKANQLVRQIEVLEKEVENLTAFLTQYESRIEPLKVEMAQYESNYESWDKQQKEIHNQMAENESALVQINEKIAKLLSSNKHFFQKKQNLESALDGEELERNKAITEKQLLTSLEEDYEGYEKGVKEVLKGLHHQKGIHGIVASLIEVPQAYEVAIEVALGRAVQNVVCDTLDEAKICIEFLRNRNLGRATFLPLENFEKEDKRESKTFEKHEGWIGLASDLIQFDEKYTGLVQQLLGRIAVVEDFDQASKMLKVKGFNYKIVTLKGDVLVPKGPITGGSFKSKVSNLLGRKRQIESLGKRIIELEKSIDENQKELKQVNLTLSENETLLKACRSEADDKRLLGVKLDNQKENLLTAKEKEKESLDKLRHQLEEIQRAHGQAEEAILEKRDEIDRHSSTLNGLQKQLDVFKDDLSQLEIEVENHSQECTSLQIQMASAEQNLMFKEKEMLRIQDDLSILIQKITLRMTQLSDYEHQNEQFSNQANTVEASIVKLKSKIEVLDAQIKENQRNKQDRSSEISGLAQEISTLNRKHDEIKETLHKAEIKLAKLEVEKDAVLSELWDKYEMSMAEAMVYDVEPPNVDVKKLKLDIKLMGVVNIGAIGEYEEVYERHKFLIDQKQDLTDSISQLEKIIKELDKKMEVLFKENFECINEHFKETFKSLFNGGDAELILADYDDLLNCDIEIIAQPPGKKLQSINLLSGGEKALTAIALLFAILRTKPTPFCILDEIEAALDDVNVYRFAEFIKYYAQNSQFVVITHRKGTMEVADMLYGVTMEEYGISKVLSVKLEDVEDKYN